MEDTATILRHLEIALLVMDFAVHAVADDTGKVSEPFVEVVKHPKSADVVATARFEF